MKIHLILIALLIATILPSCTFVPNGGVPIVGAPPVGLPPHQFRGPQFGGPQFVEPQPNYGSRMGSQVGGFTPFRMNYPQWQAEQGGQFNNSPRW